MYPIKRMAFLLLLLGSCKTPSKEKLFIEEYKLSKYDTIYIVSSISCGGCVGDYFKNKNLNRENTILIFDNSSTNLFIENLKKFKHINLSQNILDNKFDNFGNIITLTKIKEDYIMTSYDDK
jgi:hypothetical protein